MSALAINLRWSEIRAKIRRPKLYNLQISKKSEQVQTVQIELSMNKNTQT